MTTDAPPPTGAAQLGPNDPFEAVALTASLTVRDLDASLAWYRDVLGFTIAQEYGPPGTRHAIALAAGPIRILIVRDDGAKGLDRAKGGGMSLQFTTRQSIDALADRAKAHGATLEAEPADMRGARVFRLHDPDGFKLVISSVREG